MLKALEAFCRIVEWRNPEGMLLSVVIGVGPWGWPNSTKMTLMGQAVFTLW